MKRSKKSLMSRVFAMMSGPIGRQRTDRGIPATATLRQSSEKALDRFARAPGLLVNPKDSLCGDDT
jgi:hypothetical protein